jgi:SAM-dependent methyltransferase
MRNNNVYGAYSAAYALHSEVSPHNVLYERPAMRSLIGDARGLDVLDVGCGAGILMRDLLSQGAREVVGVDGDPILVDIARQKLGSLAEVTQHDICEPFATSLIEHFQLVTASLVLHYIKDWTRPLANIHAVLGAGGRLVFSVAHPSHDVAFVQSSYFCVEEITERWQTLGIDVTTFRRSLEAMFDATQAAGFVLNRILEPRPLPEMQVTHPHLYAELIKQPLFILFSLDKA